MALPCAAAAGVDSPLEGSASLPWLLTLDDSCWGTVTGGANSPLPMALVLAASPLLAAVGAQSLTGAEPASACDPAATAASAVARLHY